jgi:hypothetical protein
MKIIKQQQTQNPNKSISQSQMPYSFDPANKITPFTTHAFQENIYTGSAYLCIQLYGLFPLFSDEVLGTNCTLIFGQVQYKTSHFFRAQNDRIHGFSEDVVKVWSNILQEYTASNFKVDAEATRSQPCVRKDHSSTPEFRLSQYSL